MTDSLIAGAVGGGIGVLIDWLWGRPKLIYARPGGSTTGVKLQPILGRDRAGVAASLTF